MKHAEQSNPEDQDFSRRDLLRRAAVLGIGVVAFRISSPDVRHDVAAAELAEQPAFGLPVPKDKKDSRIAQIQIHDQITLDPSLHDHPLGKRIKKIGFNPKFSKWAARNRLGIATSNALIRAHAVAEQYLDGQNYEKIVKMLQAGEIPSDPNWADYEKRLASDEKLLIPMMALPEDAPATYENAQWAKADLRKGVKLNFVSDPGVFSYETDENLNHLDGWSARVDKHGQLQMDLYWNNGLYPNYPDQQDLYNFTFSTAIVRSLASVTMSLGIIAEDPGYYYNLYNAFYIINYSGSGGEDGGKDNYGTSPFSEQRDIALGTAKDKKYPDALLHVEFDE